MKIFANQDKKNKTNENKQVLHTLHGLRISLKQEKIPKKETPFLFSLKAFQIGVNYFSLYRHFKF